VAATPSHRPVEILLVEDNPADVRLTREALRESRVIHHLNSVKDGVEAMEYLHRAGSYTGVSQPDIILLDLNLPRMGGLEVLKQVKQDERLKHIPVIVLTTSKAEQDLLHAYDLHTNCYITKPVDLEQFFQVIHSIEEFWLSIVRLPRTE
jgi:two-component system, chemotaxis family, response regulator Rcp1